MSKIILVIFLIAAAFSATVYDECSGSGVGDPYFIGFHGQRFGFSGHAGGIYSIFNDEYTNLNAKFKSAKTSRGSGTVMGSIGLLIGKTPIIISSDDRNASYIEIEVSGKRMKIKKQHTITEDCIQISNVKNAQLLIETMKYQFTINFQFSKHSHIVGSYLDVKVTYPIESEDKVRGVLGQTASKTASISTNDSYFNVSSLLASDSKTGIYKMRTESACKFDAPESQVQVRDAHHIVRGSVDCTYPTPERAQSMEGLASSPQLPFVVGYNPLQAKRDSTVYYLTNDINTISNFAHISLQAESVMFTSILNNQQPNPFVDGPFFDMKTSNIYFVRSVASLEQMYQVGFTLTWDFEGLSFQLDLSVKFCPTDSPNCDSSVTPVPTNRGRLNGEACEVEGCAEVNIYGLSYCRYSLEGSGVCAEASPGCVSEDTPVLMADGTSKQIKDIKLGDMITGSDGKPALVYETSNRLLKEGRLVSINNSPYFATPDHPFQDATDPTKMLVADVDLAVALVPEHEGILKKMKVGDYISKWDAASRTYSSTLIESIKTANYPTDTLVYDLISIPLEPKPDYIFAGFGVHNYLTSPIWFHIPRKGLGKIFSAYTAMKVKSDVDAAFSKQTAIRDKLTFYGFVAASMKNDVNTYVQSQYPLAGATIVIPHVVTPQFTAGAKQLLYQIELFTATTPDFAAFVQIMASQLDLSGLFDYEISDATAFVDDEFVPFVKNWISKH